MQISQSGIDLIKSFEGLRLDVYNDAAGMATIGYGHVLLPGQNWTTITEAHAEALLRSDIARFEAAVNKLVAVPLSQNQFDALVSFAYNVGDHALAQSTLLKKLNAGDYAGAADEFPRWNKATINGTLQELPGLTRRRNAERALFLQCA